MYIFIDLDGPILDNSPRLYGLYADLCQKKSIIPLSKEKYWQYKREKITEELILEKTKKVSAGFLNFYERQRRTKIESIKYLSLNKTVLGCYNCLNFLSKQGDLILITTRKNKINLNWELNNKKLKKYFTKILCGSSQSIEAYKVKIDLINKNIKNYKNNSIIIGDTEAEILCAQKLGVFSIGLTCGIRSIKQIKRLKPYIICKDLNEVIIKWPEIIKKLRVQ